MLDFQEQLQNIKNTNYDKEFKSFDEQLQILKDRKLIISNDDFVISKLKRINYYRLSAYFLPFQHPKNSDKKDMFLENTTFEDIIQLYYFDCELRKIIFEAIEVIEIYFRTQITYYHSLNYGPLGYLIQSNFEVKEDYFFKMIEKIKNDVNRSDEKFVKHLIEKYNSNNFPIWAVIEIVSFGTISKFYTMLKTEEQKSVIQELKGINNKVFKNWLHGLSVVRNICAHHSRLWNKTLGVKFEIPRKIEAFRNISVLNEKRVNDKTSFVLSVIEYILKSIGEDELDFKVKIHDLLKKYPSVKFQSMGFTPNWESNPIWKI